MIFDLADPLRSFSTATAPLIGIAATFSVDFLHMTGNLHADDREDAHPLLDALISLLFCFAYFSLAYTTKTNKAPTCFYCVLSLSLLAVTHLSIVLYEIKPLQNLGKRDLARLCPFLICSAGAIVAFFCAVARCALYINVISTILSCIAYLIYVFCLWESGHAVGHTLTVGCDSGHAPSPSTK